MKVLLFATTTGYQIRSFGEAAERCGVRLVFASDRCDRLEDPWLDQAVPVRFDRETSSIEALRAALASDPPAGIIAVGDAPTVLAAHAAAAFGLPGNPPDAAAASRNKREARAAFARAGVSAAHYQEVSIDADPGQLAGTITYPVVIKPLALSGSRGVMRVDTPAEFVERFGRLRALLRAPDVLAQAKADRTTVLVEAFVPGRELAIEGVLTGGVLTPFAIFDKPDPLDGPFFEETIYVTPSRASRDEQSQILTAIGAAARALGLVHGPVHAECRVHAAGVHVLEVAARPIGGLCSRALRFHASGGVTASLEEVLLRHAIGEDIGRYAREEAASGVMMVPIPRRGVYRGAAGVDDARRVPGVEEVTITAKRDALLVPLPEGRSYLGFIFARGDDPAAVERALRAAHARLRFTIDPAVPVL